MPKNTAERIIDRRVGNGGYVTAGAGRTPVAGPDGLIALEWIPQGEGSGLDADMVDGQHATAFAAATHDHDDRYYTESETDTLLGGYVLKSTFDANSLLIATTDDTPTALAVSASTIVGRAATGGIAALSASDARTVLGLGTMATEAETGYAKLAGRAGGQTLIGGTGSGENLTLQSTSNATKGNVETNGIALIHTAADISGYKTVVRVSTPTDGNFRVINNRSSGSEFLPSFVFESAGVAGRAATFIGYIPTDRDAQNSNFACITMSARKTDETALSTALIFAVQNYTTNALSIRADYKAIFADSVAVGNAYNAPPTISDGVGIDVSGKILRLRSSKTPASATATGNVGEICWDSGAIYVCYETNKWKKAAIATW